MNKDELIEELMKQSDKIFFYCVKRCNSRSDAEDLSQDILLDIIININKGIEIENFDYYIWQICKNHYSKYVKEKVKKRENITVIEEIDKPGNDINSLDKLINSEKIALMNTSIKLLSRDYSEILYSYYIEDNTISYIAKNLNLPLGTVKRRLFDIRNKLKEYLKMERLSGKKAFVPKEYVGMISYDEKPNCNPYEITKSLLVKNLLFHSYGNPCTIEEYSIELGISRPYIEDYLNDLINYDLIEKVQNKYLTKIAFINQETRRNILNYVRDNINELSNKIIDYCKNNINYYRSLIDNKNITDDLLLWSFILLTILVIENSKSKKYTKRKDGSCWDFCLMETINQTYKDEFFISCNGVNSPVPTCKLKAITFPCMTIENKNNVSKILFTKNASNGIDLDLQFFSFIINQKINYNMLSIEEKQQIDKYQEKNYFSIINDEIRINIPVISNNNYENLLREILLNGQIVKAYNDLYDNVYLKVKELIPCNIENQTNFIISAACNTIRSLILSSAYDKCIIKEDENSNYFVYNMILIR